MSQYAVYAFVGLGYTQDKISSDRLNWMGAWNGTTTYRSVNPDAVSYGEDKYIVLYDCYGTQPLQQLGNKVQNPFSLLVVYTPGFEPPFTEEEITGTVPAQSYIALETAWAGTALAYEALTTAWEGTALAETAIGMAGSQSNYFTVGPTATDQGTIVLDFWGSRFQTTVMTGDGTFVSTDRDIGVAISAKIDSGGTNRNLYFHPDWTFLQTQPLVPTPLAAGQLALMSLTAFGPNESDVIAVYAPSA
jgi:hypothetical protein